MSITVYVISRNDETGEESLNVFRDRTDTIIETERDIAASTNRVRLTFEVSDAELREMAVRNFFASPGSDIRMN